MRRKLTLNDESTPGPGGREDQRPLSTLSVILASFEVQELKVDSVGRTMQKVGSTDQRSSMANCCVSGAVSGEGVSQYTVVSRRAEPISFVLSLRALAMRSPPKYGE